MRMRRMMRRRMMIKKMRIILMPSPFSLISCCSHRDATLETWPFSWMMMMMRRRIVMKMTMVMTLLFLHGVATVLLLQ